MSKIENDSKILSESTLRDLIFNKRLSKLDISKKYKISKNRLNKLIKFYNIDLTNKFNKYFDDKEDLLREYIEEKNLTYKEISELHNNISIGVIKKAAKKFNISYPTISLNISKLELEDLIFNKKLSITDICRLYNVSDGVIRYKLRLFGLYDRYLNRNNYSSDKITTEDSYITTFPVLIRYTYPIVQKLILTTGTVKEIYYIPEINKWIRKNALKHVLISNGLDVDDWIERWLNRPGILSESEVDNIINKLYPSYLIDTRSYAKSILINKPLTKFSRGLITKKDWIRLAEEAHQKGKYPYIKYDYTKLPEFIPNRNYKVVITCLEINPDTGEIYGDFETNYTCFVTNSTNHPELAKKLSAINRTIYITETYILAAKKVHGNDKYGYDKVVYKTLKDDIIIYCNKCKKYFKQSAGLHLSGANCWDCAHEISAKSHILSKDEFIRRSIEANGDIYDYSEVVYIDCETPVKIKNKLTGNIFYQKPKIHVLGHGDGDISKGESYIKLWAKDNNIRIRPHVLIRLSNIARKTDRVYIDCIISVNNNEYYIEYNGYQHYKMIPFFHKTDKDFSNQLRRDQNVREYCKDNNIILIEIPYTYNTYKKVRDLLDRVILGGEDINTIIDYQNLYK